MKKEFYIGQPLIIKGTREKVVLLNNDGKSIRSISVWNGNERIYCHSDDLEPSTEFKLSELMAGMEQGYFEDGTMFTGLDDERQTLEVKHGSNGLYLDWWGSFIPLSSTHFSSTWILEESRKEMSLE